MPGPEGDPALYRVDRSDADADAEPAGWLFGTIHALPSRSRWKSDALKDALAKSGVLIVEVADLDDAQLRDTFNRMAFTNGLPPLEQRVSPELRDDLDELIDNAGANPAQFRNLETWAAALTLSSAMQANSGIDPADGVDRVLIGEYASGPVLGLETVEQQFSLFDTLAEKEQRELLESMLTEGDEDAEEMSDAWLSGDTERLATLMNEGLGPAGDPGNLLRNRLLTRRNESWVAAIAAQLSSGARPFVAVGAGHVGGEDGLIALLESEGWRVTRVE
ncbi:TraB/GumN family protein [Croceicoccus mobilis]|uniref:TraB/GumN family protein n=1 Tax=Croceicoccus mobilis TaxID=1703339 RepID=A0A917DWI5_9SPHN|nr:TraB/GumN family protein [Croceicoccus mobilis]GGD75492.1 hypothetical protein GCM10010990_26370 [Croceicoccus mobilis]